MEIMGIVYMAAVMVGMEQDVKQNAIKIVLTIYANKVRGFVQKDATKLCTETHVIGSVLRCVNRFVIDL